MIRHDYARHYARELRRLERTPDHIGYAAFGALALAFFVLYWTVGAG